MARFLLLILVNLLSLLICMADDELCPPSHLISPCECNGEGINCMKAKDDAELQKVFANIPRPWAFRGVWIQITDMSIVPSYMFKDIQVRDFHLEVNRIGEVLPNAFNGSEQSATIINLFGNRIYKFPYDDLKKFSFLKTFNIARNKINNIPEDAFRGILPLTTIVFAENVIDSIGPNAFEDLPNLQRLDLSHNRLNILGPQSMSMRVHSPVLTLNLANNSLTSVSPTAFQDAKPKLIKFAMNRLQYLDGTVFLPLIRRMVSVRGLIDVSFNPFVCQGCSYRWMVMSQRSLQHLIRGFLCKDRRRITDLTMDNIGCHVDNNPKL